MLPSASSPRVLSRAALSFALLAGCSTPQAWFSYDADLESVVVGELDAATDSAHVAIYAFTSEAIQDALIEAAGRGVEVQIVADLSQSSEPNEEPVLARLQNAGLDLRLASGFNYGIMHHKFAVLDGRTVLTGSFNYTDSAKDRNDENLLVFADARLAATYETAFQELWARAEAR